MRRCSELKAALGVAAASICFQQGGGGVAAASICFRAPSESSQQRQFASEAGGTGLLMARYGFEMKAAVVGNTLKGPMKGGLYENLAACMLACNGVPLHYRMSANGSQEVEFLVDRGASVVPVEMKASRGSTASLDRLLQREDVKLGYKLIDGNAGKAGKKTTLPLYLAPFLFRRT